MRDETSSGIDFPYTFEKRLNELEDGFETSLMFKESLNSFFVEMEFRYGKNSGVCIKEDFWSLVREDFIQLVNKTRAQPGYALSVFFYLEDLWLGIINSGEQYQKLDLLSFLSMENHLLFPMKLVRPGEKYLDEVKSPKYISCLYVLDYKQDIIVSPFLENEIHKVWFNRIKHSSLASFNNVFAAGVMYFCPKTKNLLYVNNASGHYRLKSMKSCESLISPLSQLNVDLSLCRYSGYDDVEFIYSVPLIKSYN